MPQTPSSEPVAAATPGATVSVVTPAVTTGDPRYRVGTLQYTKLGLFVLFGWLLWGDFCFQLMEVVIRLVYIAKLEDLKSNNAVQSLAVITIPAAMNFMVTPVVSFRSDRYRSRWGRRIPFLLWSTPFLTLCLVLIGYSEQIGNWLHGPLSGYWKLSPTGAVVLTMVVLMGVLQFFNMFVSSVYYYLFNDVVPTAFLGRFMALFRLVGFLATGIFNKFILGASGSYTREIFVGAGLLYFVSFMVMCWRVKEGQYPPPPANLGNRVGVLASAKTYFKECFTHPFYICYFIYSALWMTATVFDPWRMHFAQSIGMDRSEFGDATAYILIAQMALIYPAGMLADRFHPLRVQLVAGCLVPVVNLLVFLLARGQTSYTVMLSLLLPLMAFYTTAAIPTLMLLLPKERYGQFGSADAMGRSLCLIVGGQVSGFVLDKIHQWTGADDYRRYIHLWACIFQVLALIFFVMVYRGWQRHGGREHYKPPMV